MGRAGSSSSSVPSSSPSLSLSDERAGPGGGATGAWCLSSRQEHGRGLVHEKEGAAEYQVLSEEEQGHHTKLCGQWAEPVSVPLTVWVQKPFGERLVLAAWPLADAGAAQPGAASC